MVIVVQWPDKVLELIIVCYKRQSETVYLPREAVPGG